MPLVNFSPLCVKAASNYLPTISSWLVIIVPAIMLFKNQNYGTVCNYPPSRQPAQADDHRCGNPVVEEDVLLFGTLLCDVGEATEGEDNDEPVVQDELQGDDGDDDALCLAAALVPTLPWLPPPSKYIHPSLLPSMDKGTTRACCCCWLIWNHF